MLFPKGGSTMGPLVPDDGEYPPLKPDRLDQAIQKERMRPIWIALFAGILIGIASCYLVAVIGYRLTF
ncbi:hypothetical protein A2635_05040 [Candidatus Peribacteria bacterium RIFCSPHIGHO2_01_FULL_51_9]|nr:MAG: hypothetical protein A2635_05040 [Candidatus Peribacteria bacterium RIFCSPHIGHO2_01_FULL_51_9]